MIFQVGGDTDAQNISAELELIFHVQNNSGKVTKYIYSSYSFEVFCLNISI